MIKYLRWTFPAFSLLCCIIAFFSANWVFWLLVAMLMLVLFSAMPFCRVFDISTDSFSPAKKLCVILVALITIIVCVSPMGQLSLWNGEIPGHRNQYELITEAFLDGRLDFAYGDEDSLAGLENPYDPQEREDANVFYHWDHAYYKGHYYMYFGVVPVFLAFLPYRLLTGTALPTFQATMLFTAVIIAGIFTLFHLLTKLFFKRLPFALYLILSVTFSVMSVWYASAEPALYCTAITAAIALEIWSLYFFIRSVWLEERLNRQILLAGIGALLGALVFGCRPPIALANVLVIPILIVFLRKHKFSLSLLGKLALAALPYAVVAAGLMLYNYARFENPFEFGQTYQLTVADQTKFHVAWDAQTRLRLFNESILNFFQYRNQQILFPYLNAGGIFTNFPILLLSILICRSEVFKRARKLHLLPLLLTFPIAAVVINVFDILWTPYLLERYHMDLYFLLGIGCFIIIGLWYETCQEKYKKWLGAGLSWLSLKTVIVSFLFYVGTVGVYYPEQVTHIAESLNLN